VQNLSAGLIGFAVLLLAFPIQGAAQGTILELRAGAEIPTGNFAEFYSPGFSGGVALLAPVSQRLSLVIRGGVTLYNAEPRATFGEPSEPPFFQNLTVWRYSVGLRQQLLTGQQWTIGLSLGAGAVTQHVSEDIGVVPLESVTQTDPAFSGGVDIGTDISSSVRLFGASDLYFTPADGAFSIDQDLWSLGFSAGSQIRL